jgi:lipoic acid synthetase
MILGDLCTRSCRFCAVGTSREGRPVREEEGLEIAAAAEELALDYVVLTSVDRDDLALRGADHFARCIRSIKERIPACRVEALIPDYYGEELERVIRAGPDVIAHNVETVRLLQGLVRDRRSDFDKSLRTLRETAQSTGVQVRRPLVKSSILLGFGETEEELFSAMDELVEAGVKILVLGQYLRPSKNQIPVAEYVSPESFARYGEAAREKGFTSVVSAPLARTSYHAKKSHAAACPGMSRQERHHGVRPG